MSVRRIMFALAAVMLTAGAASADEADQGVVCATAGKAPVDQLPAVIAACSWIQRKQPTPADQARVWRYLGIALYRSGDLPAAIANFDKTLRVTPDDAWALQPRAEANERLGNPQLAIPDYERLLRLQPGTRWKIKLAELGAPPELASREEPAPSRSEPTPRSPNQDAAVPGAPPDKTLVTKLQKALSELGYPVPPVPVDGAVGDSLRKAITKFAADYSLPTNGEPSPLLLTVAQTELASRQAEKARPPSPEEAQRQAAEAQQANEQRRAAEEQAALVRRAQASLADLGYQIGDIDGVVGSRTRNALADMARKLGLPTPRNVDLALIEKLEAAVVDQPTEVAAVEPPREAGPPPAPEKVEPPVIIAPAPPSSVAVAPPDLPPVAPALPPPEPKAPQSQPPVMAAKQTGEHCTRIVDASQEKRVALVIGNSAYENLTELRNPRADAEDMAASLCELGFDVIEGFDLGLVAMNAKTSEFARRAETADLAFVYYAGHGVQVQGDNYLIPTDALFEDKRDLRSLIRLDQLTEDSSNSKKAIVVVDACRDDPTQAGSETKTRSIGRAPRTPVATGVGLAQPYLQPGSRTLVAFATKPGMVASDGRLGDRNSPYVAAILRHIKTPGVDVTRMFGMVQEDVAKETRNAQEPIYTASLGSEQVFLVAAPPQPKGLALDQLTQGERRAIQNSLKWMSSWEAPVDGQVSAALVNNIKSIQRMRGDEATGMLTPEQTVALHRQAQYSRPPEPLPPINLDDATDRAASGDPVGQRELGMASDPLFAAMIGRSKDRARAISWYQKAVAQNDRTATTRLGILLATSVSPDDQATAREMLGKAVDAGDPVAALRLAELLQDGPQTAGVREETIRLLTVARASTETEGFAAARLRMLGVPVT